MDDWISGFILLNFQKEILTRTNNELKKLPWFDYYHLSEQTVERVLYNVKVVLILFQGDGLFYANACECFTVYTVDQLHKLSIASGCLNHALPSNVLHLNQNYRS